MNEGGTVRFYVPLHAAGGSSTPIRPIRIRIDPEELELKIDDEPVQLKVAFSPSVVIDRRVAWASSNEEVVTVSSRGRVTVVGPGVATITATAVSDPTVSDTIEVRVLGEEVELPELPFHETMFNAGFTEAFMELDDSGLFGPELTMTRRELTHIMACFLQEVEGLKPQTGRKYTDLTGDDAAIYEMDRWGIVQGIGGGLFAPDQLATRAEISVMLCRMLMLPIDDDPDAPHAFTDAGPEDTWAWAYIDALAKAGITKGSGDDCYSPKRLVTRAEVATFLARMLVTIVDSDRGEVLVPKDVTKDHWAYTFILRAVNGEPAVRLLDEYLEPTQQSSDSDSKRKS